MSGLGKLADYGPVFFGVGFVAPLIAQSLDAASWTAPAGLSNIAFGLVVGAALGTIAKLRGRWI
jgi:hypothetical protein